MGKGGGGGGGGGGADRNNSLQVGQQKNGPEFKKKVFSRNPAKRKEREG